MKYLGKLFAFLLLCSTVAAGSVRLVNDTATKLRAVVRAADGSYLGEVIVNPKQTMSWSDYTGGVGYYNQSQTPYTVLWFCTDDNNSPFSINDNVGSGATVTALQGSGTRSCPPPKKQRSAPTQGPFSEEHLQQQTQQDAGPPEGVLD